MEKLPFVYFPKFQQIFLLQREIGELLVCACLKGFYPLVSQTVGFHKLWRLFPKERNQIFMNKNKVNFHSYQKNNNSCHFSSKKSLTQANANLHLFFYLNNFKLLKLVCHQNINSKQESRKTTYKTRSLNICRDFLKNIQKTSWQQQTINLRLTRHICNIQKNAYR